MRYQDTEISFVKEYVYLDNIVDNNLIMNTNFDRAYKKANACSSQIVTKPVRKYLTLDVAQRS